MMIKDIDRWFDLSIDPESRTIYMGSMAQTEDGGEVGVDFLMAEFLIKSIHTLESKNSKPILIIMNNPGGDVYHGMAIYDAIRFSKCHITIKVYGYAMSMGSIILQAADTRIMMPNSRFMIHYGSNGIYSHARTFEKWGDESKRLNKITEDIYLDAMLKKEEEMGEGYLAKKIAEFINYSNELEIKTNNKKIKLSFSKDYAEKREDLRETLRELLNFDTFLSPEQTVAFGLADSVYSIE